MMEERGGNGGYWILKVRQWRVQGNAWACNGGLRECFGRVREICVLALEWGVKASFYRQKRGGFPYTTRSRISIDGDIFLIRNRSPNLVW